MSRHLRLVALACLLLSLVLIGADARAQPTPGPTTRHQARMEGEPILGAFDVVQLLLDFAPGAWTPLHHHPGRLMITVIEGDITRKADGMEHTYRVGETWIEETGHVHEAGNPTTVATAVTITGVIPDGAPITINDGPAPPLVPATRHLHRTDGMPFAGPYEIVHMILDFAPGAQTPPHTHGGQGPVLVIDGEITHRIRHGQHAYKVGGGWVEIPDLVGLAANATTTQATVFFSVILPLGNAVTTPVPSLECVYFNVAKHSLCHGFHAYWQEYGGLAVYGYPLGEETTENGVTVQWFERARFEWHPGTWPERHDVLLGRIGAELAELMEPNSMGIGFTAQ